MESLVKNQSLQLSIDMITTFKDKWNWEALSSNESLPLSVELINSFIDNWDWHYLSINIAHNATNQLIDFSKIGYIGNGDFVVEIITVVLCIKPYLGL